MDPTDLTGIPVQYQVYILYFVVGLKLLGQFISSVKNGGGLRRIILTFWFGENLPKPLAEECRRKESSAPFSNPNP